MIRIGVDYTSAVRQRAGIGRYTRELFTAVAELDRENRYTLFSAGRDSEDVAWPANFRRRSLPLSDRHLSIVWQRLHLPLPVELITGRIDLYHSPDFVLPPILNATMVLTVHDLSFMRHPECSSPPLLNYLMRNVPGSVRRADMLLADSMSTKEDLIDLLNVPPERVHVVYPGVSPRFAPVTAPVALRAVARRYHLRRPYILALGTLQPRKNFPSLIRAFDLLRKERGIPHQLVIGGSQGWLYQEIYDTIEALGLNDDVHLAGFVADDDLPAMYSGADVFAFPSLYEGFGIPVLEAMACNTPVVTSRASSLPEVAGDAALMVEPGDIESLAEALGRLVDDDGLRNDLCARGHEQAKRFTWQRAANDLLRAYRHNV